MAVNRGKKFEDTFEKCVEKVPGVTIIRLHDQTMGYLGAKNPCDYIVYKKPYLYAIECKSVHGNTLPIHSNDPKHKYGAITNYQWESLLKMSEVDGVVAGIVCWWVDNDETWFIPIWVLSDAYENGEKSINIKHPYMQGYWILITGKKKRVFFDYDMDLFFHTIEKRRRHK